MKVLESGPRHTARKHTTGVRPQGRDVEEKALVARHTGQGGGTQEPVVLLTRPTPPLTPICSNGGCQQVLHFPQVAYLIHDYKTPWGMPLPIWRHYHYECAPR